MVSQLNKRHVIHIIPSLERGGAEHTLMRLILHTDPKLIEHSIICLKEEGALLEQVKPHLKHFTVLQRSRWNFFALAQILKNWNPDSVQTWMYTSNIIGGLAAKLASIRTIFWNIRITKLEWRYHNISAFIACYLNALCSYFIPRRIVYCSESGLTFHQTTLHYCKTKGVFIPNGLDITYYALTAKEKIQARKSLQIPSDAFVIGMLARFHPQKDFQTFFQAAAKFQKMHPNTHFVLAGNKVVTRNAELNSLIPSSIKKHVHLLGNHSHVQEVLAALDLFTLASMAEGFPNVVAEAMACGIPAVASDVGDAKVIIQNTGWVIPTKNIQTLIEAWEEALKNDLEAKGTAAQNRIKTTFSLQKMIDAYTNLYMKE